MMRQAVIAVLAVLSFIHTCAADVVLRGFGIDQGFGEQVREQVVQPGVRLLINAPAVDQFKNRRPTLVLFYACPNGNSIEWTLGARMSAGMDWHFDIQHVAAQTRKLRDVATDRNIVLVVLEAEGRSWPAWRRQHERNGEIIRGIVDQVLQQIPGTTSVALAGHSGGGSFITGYLNGGDAIGGNVDRIVYLDANYSYSDEEEHGDKILAWLRHRPDRRLVVIAYDDRNIMLEGKKVNSDTGGTFRATQRMLDRLKRDADVSSSTVGEFHVHRALEGQVELLVHLNPQNEILHTVLIGEMNGLLHAMTLGTKAHGAWGKLGRPRVYAQWIAPPAAEAQAAIAELPERADQAPGGLAVMEQVAALPLEHREKVIFEQVARGNVPRFLRQFTTIRVEHAGRVAEYQVMPDYLAVGSDDDFIRAPLTPMTAQRIADAFGWFLPTRAMVDHIYAQADVKLEPQPMTERREAVETFAEHSRLIESQRAHDPLGALLAGIKKDVVLTNRLKEKPNRVAIYGWHQLNGKPIQPLTIVHKDTYVDYSHGIRFVKRQLLVDRQATTIERVLADPELAPLLSDEGVIDSPRYP
jgi:hypothetical protein